MKITSKIIGLTVLGLSLTGVVAYKNNEEMRKDIQSKFGCLMGYDVKEFVEEVERPVNYVKEEIRGRSYEKINHRLKKVEHDEWLAVSHFN
jgi:hypothetical protein